MEKSSKKKFLSSKPLDCMIRTSQGGTGKTHFLKQMLHQNSAYGAICDVANQTLGSYSNQTFTTDNRSNTCFKDLKDFLNQQEVSGRSLAESFVNSGSILALKGTFLNLKDAAQEKSEYADNLADAQELQKKFMDDANKFDVQLKDWHKIEVEQHNFLIEHGAAGYKKEIMSDEQYLEKLKERERKIKEKQTLEVARQDSESSDEITEKINLIEQDIALLPDTRRYEVIYYVHDDTDTESLNYAIQKMREFLKKSDNKPYSLDNEEYEAFLKYKQKIEQASFVDLTQFIEFQTREGVAKEDIQPIEHTLPGTTTLLFVPNYDIRSKDLIETNKFMLHVGSKVFQAFQIDKKTKTRINYSDFYFKKSVLKNIYKSLQISKSILAIPNQDDDDVVAMQKTFFENPQICHYSVQQGSSFVELKAKKKINKETGAEYYNKHDLSVFRYISDVGLCWYRCQLSDPYCLLQNNDLENINKQIIEFMGTNQQTEIEINKAISAMLIRELSAQKIDASTLSIDDYIDHCNTLNEFMFPENRRLLPRDLENTSNHFLVTNYYQEYLPMLTVFNGHGGFFSEQPLSLLFPVHNKGLDCEGLYINLFEAPYSHPTRKKLINDNGEEVNSSFPTGYYLLYNRNFFLDSINSYFNKKKNDLGLEKSAFSVLDREMVAYLSAKGIIMTLSLSKFDSVDFSATATRTVGRTFLYNETLNDILTDEDKSLLRNSADSSIFDTRIRERFIRLVRANSDEVVTTLVNDNSIIQGIFCYSRSRTNFFINEDRQEVESFVVKLPTETKFFKKNEKLRYLTINKVNQLVNLITQHEQDSLYYDDYGLKFFIDLIAHFIGAIINKQQVSIQVTLDKHLDNKVDILDTGKIIKISIKDTNIQTILKLINEIKHKYQVNPSWFLNYKSSEFEFVDKETLDKAKSIISKKNESEKDMNKPKKTILLDINDLNNTNLAAFNKLDSEGTHYEDGKNDRQSSAIKSGEDKKIFVIATVPENIIKSDDSLQMFEAKDFNESTKKMVLRAVEIMLFHIFVSYSISMDLGNAAINLINEGVINHEH